MESELPGMIGSILHHFESILDFVIDPNVHNHSGDETSEPDFNVWDICQIQCYSWISAVP